MTSAITKELFKAPVPGDPAKQLMRLMDPKLGEESGFERVREAYLYRLYNKTVEHVRSNGDPEHRQVEFAEIPEDILALEEKALKAAEKMGAGEILKNLQAGKYQMMDLGAQHMPTQPPPGWGPSSYVANKISETMTTDTVLGPSDLPANPAVTEHSMQSLLEMGMDKASKEEVALAETKLKNKNILNVAKTLGALPGKAIQRIKAEGSVFLQGKAPQEAIEHRITCCTGITADGTIVSAPCPHLDSTGVAENVRDGHCEACGCPKDKTTRIARKATMPAYACPKKHWSKVQGVRVIKDGKV